MVRIGCAYVIIRSYRCPWPLNAACLSVVLIIVSCHKIEAAKRDDIYSI